MVIFVSFYFLFFWSAGCWLCVYFWQLLVGKEYTMYYVWLEVILKRSHSSKAPHISLDIFTFSGINFTITLHDSELKLWDEDTYSIIKKTVSSWSEQTFDRAWNRCPRFRWPQWLKIIPHVRALAEITWCDKIMFPLLVHKWASGCCIIKNFMHQPW